MAIGIISGINSKNKNNIQLAVSSNFILLGKNETTTVTVNSPSDGNIYAMSADTNIATVSVNNNVITINTLAYGSTVINIGQGTGTGDYSSTTPEIISIFVLVSLAGLGNTFNDSTWQAISTLSQEGSAATYWSVGDQKSIVLNGDIGVHCTINNLALNVFILHINMPINGVADNNIILGGFKTADGIDVSLYEQFANAQETVSNDGLAYFNPYHYNTGASNGGWKGCDMRYDIVGAVETPPAYCCQSTQDYYAAEYTNPRTGKTIPEQLPTPRTGYDATSAAITNPVSDTVMAALPNDFRSVLKLWDRYFTAQPTSDVDFADYRAHRNLEENITKNVDAGISLLSEFEVWGTIIKGNPYEADHQIFLDYYAAGNSTWKMSIEEILGTYDPTGAAQARNPWWLASWQDGTGPISVHHNYSTGEDYVYAMGTGVMGIAPAFKI